MLDLENIDESDLLNEDNFRSFFNTVIAESNDDDLKRIIKIREDLKKYDIFDFAKSISSLNLFPENQNKIVLLSIAIGIVLSIPVNEIDFTNKMSFGKLKQTIREIEELNISRNIDPSEFPFVQQIIYYEGFNLFMGISSISADTIQNFVNAYVFNYEKLEEIDSKKINSLIYPLLRVSSDIVRQLNYNINTIEIKDIPTKLYIPSKEKLDLYKTLVVFPKDYIKALFANDEIFVEHCCDLNCQKIEDSLNFDHQHYYSRPFLESNEEVIILDITLFPLIIMRNLVSASQSIKNISLLEEFVLREEREVHEALFNFDIHKIKASQFGITLENENSYKETIYGMGTDSIIIGVCVIDNCEDYDSTKITGFFKNTKTEKKFDSRIPEITEKLLSHGVSVENIFVLITPIGCGRSYSFDCQNILDNRYLIFCPYEIKYISINERGKNLFIKRYVYAKNRLKNYKDNLFTEINLVAQYVNNDDSFYFDDRVDMKDAILSFIGEFSAEYILKAQKKQNIHLVPSYDGIHNNIVTKQEQNIYVLVDKLRDKRIKVCIDLGYFVIWIITDEIDNTDKLYVQKSYMDLLSYWLNEISEFLAIQSYSEEVLVLEIKVTGNVEDYYIQRITEFKEDLVKIEIENNKIIFEITPELFHTLDCPTNENEKKFIIHIIEQIHQKFSDDEVNYDTINKLFKNPYKKKSVTLKCSEYAYLKPFSSDDKRLISSSDENILLDDIGMYVKNELNYDYGVLASEDRHKVAQKIVKKLYLEILKELKGYSKDQLLKVLYYESERILSQLMISKNSYKYNIATYPHQKAEIENYFNELNKSSIAIKFLVELSSALKTNGEKAMSDYNLEFLMAKSFLLIDWAYKNDLFYYKIFNTPMELLNSNRIGLKQEEFNRANLSFKLARDEQMNYVGKKELRESYIAQREYLNKKVNFDEVFLDEFGYTTKSLFELIRILFDIGEETDSEIFNVDITALKNRITGKITDGEFELIINSLCLSERDDFLKPPSPYRKEDVYPWRYNRELSFARRPLIRYGDNIIWGNRHLTNTMFFLFDLIEEGKIYAKSAKMKDLKAEMLRIKGEEFNNLVYNHIASFDGLLVAKNAKKINKKHIADENGQTLGDIDVLYISPSKKLIVLVESKNFNLTKNFYEVYNEYKSLFVDDGENKSFLTKHKRRAKWIEDNLKEVEAHFKISATKWKVKYMFVVNEYSIAKDVFNQKEKVIPLSQLSERELFRF